MGEEGILDNIPHLISDQQNDLLTSFPTMEEVHNVIQDMNSDSAASPD